MWFQSWLDSFRPRTHPRAHRRARLAADRRSRKRLLAEGLENRHLLALSAPVGYDSGASPHAILSADFNNDDILDLAVANHISNVSVLLGNADGTFQPALTSATGSSPVSLAVGDFNEDGILDLVTANGNGYGGEVSLLLGNNDGAGNGTGTFQPPTSVSVGSPTSVAVGDFNGDGNLDLGVTSVYYYYWYGSYSYANVLLGTGAGSFSAPNGTWLDWGYYQSATVANVNGDLSPTGHAIDDFVSINSYGAVSVLQGDTSGLLQQATHLAPFASPSSVVAEDVNGDLVIDLVVANRFSNDVSVLLGTGGGGFAAAQNYSVGVEPTSLAVGDFNHDGLADIATTNWGSDTVSIVRGLAGGTFSLPEYFAVGPGPIALAAGDFNGDGWLDVTTANFFGTNASANTASVLLNDQNWGPVPSYVYISVSDASVTEGKRGVKYLNFTVTLSAASNVPVTVQYATQYGTATSGSDYQAQSGTLTFGVGETVKTVSIAVYGDHTFEADETFQLLLSNPTGNALISDAAGLGTIVNDDFIRGRGNGRRMR